MLRVCDLFDYSTLLNKNKTKQKETTKMKFDINNYKGKYAMHCKTEEEARSFCNYLHSIGRCWHDKDSYIDHTMYHHYRENTAYDFNEGRFWSVKEYERAEYTILEWSDFMNNTFTKADLKTGDVILRRNGSVEIVNRDLEMLICKDGWNNLNFVKNDLTDISEEFDIVAVRRPVGKSDCQFDAFEYDYGTLVYERKEIEEMTLEEVCKALGKEIKIVKG